MLIVSCVVFAFPKQIYMYIIFPTGMSWVLHVNTNCQDLHRMAVIGHNVNKLEQHICFWKCVTVEGAREVMVRGSEQLY